MKNVGSRTSGLIVLFFMTCMCSSSYGASAAKVDIKISNFAFTPATVAISTGTTVTWKNVAGNPHTTVSDDGTWDSKNLDSKQTFSFKFTRPGTYTYHCAIHPSMTAQVIVK